MLHLAVINSPCRLFSEENVSSDSFSNRNIFSPSFIVVVSDLVIFLPHWCSELQKEKSQNQMDSILFYVVCHTFHLWNSPNVCL